MRITPLRKQILTEMKTRSMSPAALADLFQPGLRRRVLFDAFWLNLNGMLCALEDKSTINMVTGRSLILYQLTDKGRQKLASLEAG